MCLGFCWVGLAVGASLVAVVGLICSGGGLSVFGCSVCCVGWRMLPDLGVGGCMVSGGWFAALELCGLWLTSRSCCFECLIVGLVLWGMVGFCFCAINFGLGVVVRLLGG